MIQSGFDVEDVTNFSKRIHSMVKVGIQAEDDVAPVEAAVEVPKIEECKDTADIDQVD